VVDFLLAQTVGAVLERATKETETRCGRAHGLELGAAIGSEEFKIESEELAEGIEKVERALRARFPLAGQQRPRPEVAVHHGGNVLYASRNPNGISLFSPGLRCRPRPRRGEAMMSNRRVRACKPRMFGVVIGGGAWHYTGRFAARFMWC
jgi:hypothetical protein